MDAAEQRWAPAESLGERGVGLRARIYRDRETAVVRCFHDAGCAAGSRVLELGREAGGLTFAAARGGHRVTLLVRLPATARTSAERVIGAGLGDSVSVQAGNPFDLSFPDESFDLVTALNIFPWETSPGGALDSIRRVLKPGGYLITSFHNRRRIPRLLDPRLNPAVAPALRRLKRWSQRKRGRHVSMESSLPVNHSAGEISDTLAASGFDIVAEKTVGFGPFTFLGKRIMPDRWSIGVHAFLQRLADSRFPLVWKGGSYYIMLARKEGPRQGTETTNP